jgi:uncharacterized protein
MKKIIEKIKKFVEEECKKPTANYGMVLYNYHLIPMVNYSKRLAEKLNADIELVEIAAWLHDIGSIKFGRENHHITGAEIAEKKLKELGFSEEKIELVKECIINHRGSREDSNKRVFVEAEIIAEADALSAFDDIAKLFWASFIEEKKDIDSARNSVLTKIKNKYKQLSQEAKEIIKPKYDAITMLLEEK